jgi:hypothetical protein
VRLAVLEIKCSVPSKKNLLRPSSNGRGRRATPLVYKAGVREQLTAIEQYIMLGWKGRPCVIHPRVVIDFFCANRLKDRDGMWTTVLDCMRRAGVIFDDSIKYFNGIVQKNPATLVANARLEKVVVTIYDDSEQAADPAEK